jgi:hypothetical protein
MIEDRAYWEAWEAGGPLRDPPDFERALAIMDDFLEHARRLGVFPPSDPLEGIEHKIALAGKLHASPSAGKALSRS